jgi:inner membrane protein
LDSLTQIILGTAVGEAVLGRKIGNKAILYGAIAGTIPDLDVIANYFTNTVTALEIHRGFSHSIVFSLLFAPIFAYIVTRYETYKNFRKWTLFFFLTLVTHPILDAQTTWGTQLFWPFEIRLQFKNIFVVDPLYTIPFLICVIMAMCYKRESHKRRFYNNLGLIVSSSYLVLTLVFKGIAAQNFSKALNQQQISYKSFDTKPAPLTTFLWAANVETETSFLIGNYSFFDTKAIQFSSFPKNHELLGDLIHKDNVRRMINISQGWYTINKENNKLYFNDLRFGLLSLKPDADNFVFKYEIQPEADGSVNFIETPKQTEDAKQLLPELWDRIKGN